MDPSQLRDIALPAEITDAIIGHLHDDPRTLSACALVCSRWIPAARFHQFARVQFSRRQTAGSFLDLLQQPFSTPITQCVHYLSIEIIDRTIRFPSPVLDILLRTLPTFSNLRTLTLSGFRLQSESYEIMRSCPSTIEELHFIYMELPSIESLFFLWTAHPRLRSFAVEGHLQFTSDASPQDALAAFNETTSKASLSELRLEWLIDRCFEVLADWICMHMQLRLFSVLIYYPEDVYFVAKMVCTQGPFLESLTLRGYDKIHRDQPAGRAYNDCAPLRGRALADCTHLRQLHLTGECEWGWASTLTEFLRPTNLTSVAILISGAWWLREGTFLVLGLEQLEGVLTGPNFTRLEKVALHLHYEGIIDIDIPEETVFEHFSRTLGKLSSRGMLEMTMSRERC